MTKQRNNIRTAPPGAVLLSLYETIHRFFIGCKRAIGANLILITAYSRKIKKIRFLAKTDFFDFILFFLFADLVNVCVNLLHGAEYLAHCFIAIKTVDDVRYVFAHINLCIPGA